MSRICSKRVHATGFSRALVIFSKSVQSAENERIASSTKLVLEFFTVMLREKPISRYLQNVLDALPSAFAQLVFLSSLRDPYTGRYLHEGWASVSTPEEVNR